MSDIIVENISKTYTVRKKKEGRLFREKQKVHALENVNFRVNQGELVGYIGPNGAGKSTTVKILSGILTPDGGDVRIGGICPWTERKKHVARIGVVFGQRTQLWWDVPVRDSYDLLRDIYRIDAASWRKRLDELCGALEIGNLLDTPLRMLSLGQRMRAELGGSLLHRPELLFLDEPTIGLDAVSKLKIREFLKTENAQNGTTVLLTTHDMEDIAALCPRVMLLGRGRLLYDGSLAQMLVRYDTTHLITVRYSGYTELPELPQTCETERDGDTIRITYPTDQVPTAMLLEILRQAGEIRELTAQPQNVDHLVAAMYKEMNM